jgi:hypothetical protein
VNLGTASRLPTEGIDISLLTTVPPYENAHECLMSAERVGVLVILHARGSIIET